MRVEKLAEPLPLLRQLLRRPRPDLSFVLLSSVWKVLPSSHYHKGSTPQPPKKTRCPISLMGAKAGSLSLVR